LADLSACRQLRHLSDTQRNAVVHYFFEGSERPMAEGKKVKHGGGCYFAWTYQASEVAFENFGAACDCCKAVVQIPHERLRGAADRALDNLDGRVRLMLCKECSMKFTAFAQRQFDREVRVPYTPELEKMMVAWLAHEVRLSARRILQQFRDGKPHARNAGARRDANNRFVPKGRNGARNKKADRMLEKHDHAVSTAGGRGQDDLPVRSTIAAPGLVLGTVQEISGAASFYAPMAPSPASART
jgi:hypothetical protein